MSSVGIYGGSFDPVHNGHLITAQYVLEKRRLSKIIFVPCNISPHKTDYVYSLSKHRLKMLELAIKPFPQFEISEYEILKGDISYTHDTLTELSKTYEKIDLIIGFDNLISFDTWKNPDGIVEIAKLIVLKRAHEQETKAFHKYYENAIYLQSPTIEISSTAIRSRVKYGKIIDCLVPDEVKKYIIDKNLYK